MTAQRELRRIRHLTDPDRVGTRLIDRLLRHELAGHATREFEPDGLVFTARLGLTGASRFVNDFGG